LKSDLHGRVYRYTPASQHSPPGAGQDEKETMARLVCAGILPITHDEVVGVDGVLDVLPCLAIFAETGRRPWTIERTVPMEPLRFLRHGCPGG
jgi:hypothetical protein